MFSVPLLLALGGGYAWLSGGRYETTDNANLHQARMLVASDLSGRVVEVGIADNRSVHKGEPLFKLDPEPYRIALEQADAAIAGARVQVQQLKAGYQTALAQRELARSDLEFAETEARRNSTLTQRGVATAAARDESQHALNRARQQVAAAEAGVVAATSALGGDPEAPVDAHPLVVQAMAARDKAAFTLGQTTVVAPADGTAYQAASFRVGQFVTAGTPLFSLVVTGDAWVEANFKETQLDGIQPGQKAEVVFDAHKKRSYEATVQAVGAGTGSEFSLLPAQNATGNWVKVTQRVPVRLSLDPGQDLSDLRSGLSAEVKIDTGRATGIERLEDRARTVAAGS